MDVYFGSVHLQTLCDLEKLANKHNYFIHFGVNQHNSEDVDIESDFGCSPEIIQELDEKGSFDGEKSKYEATELWFQLFDSNNKSYHRLMYIEGYEMAVYTVDKFEELSDEKENFLESISGDDCGYNPYCDPDIRTLYRSFDKTKIAGFPGQERPSVYREGMALKFFGDLVCDYLGEERIARTY